MNEIRRERGIAPLPTITPTFYVGRTSCLMLEAGGPLPVMDQVGNADSNTTLEIYAQVQKRVSRTNVHAAFDRLLNGADSDVACRRLNVALSSRECHVRWATDGRLRPAWSVSRPLTARVPGGRRRA